jgi:hypothetical protein
VRKGGQTHSATFPYSFVTGDIAIGSPSTITINAVEYSTAPTLV